MKTNREIDFKKLHKLAKHSAVRPPSKSSAGEAKAVVIKSINLHTTDEKTVQLCAVNLGEWHPQTATNAAWGFLSLRLKSRFWCYTFRHRMTGTAALDILNQLDGRAPELEPTSSALINFVVTCIRGHRHSGITMSRS